VVFSGIVGIDRCHEGFEKHLEDTVSNGDFPVCHLNGIVLPVSGVILLSIIKKLRY